MSCTDDITVKLNGFGFYKSVTTEVLKTFCGKTLYFSLEVLRQRHTVAGMWWLVRGSNTRILAYGGEYVTLMSVTFACEHPWIFTEDGGTHGLSLGDLVLGEH